MVNKSFRPRFIRFSALFVLCLLIAAPILAQDEEDDVGYALYAQFKKARKLPCGQRDEALKTGKKFIELYADDENNKDVVRYVKDQIPIIEKEEKACKTNSAGKSSGSLYQQFKVVELLPCGQRGEAVRLGKLILEQYQLAAKFAASFKTRMAALDEEEARCTGKYVEKLLELYEAFKTARKQPCGQRDEALSLGKEIVEKFSGDTLNNQVVVYVNEQTSKIKEDDEICKDATSLVKLFEEYKIARKQPCGERVNAIQTGKYIIEPHGSDVENQSVIGYVEKDVKKIENDDRVCKRNALYNQYYKDKYWRGFFAVSKEIITEEGDTPLALDVMLTFVAVGYRRTAYERDDFYNSDTLSYAKKAIELIESGIRTKTRWGVFEPFGEKEKALAWLNYTIGYISYFRLKENKKAIPYFYKATQYKSEFKYDAFVYHALAIHYFEKEAVSPSSLTINDFIMKANNVGLTDDALASTDETAKNNEIAMLYQQLVNLYNLRYALEPNENVTGLTEYILKLINRPLINTAVNNEKASAPAKN